MTTIQEARQLELSRFATEQCKWTTADWLAFYLCDNLNKRWREFLDVRVPGHEEHDWLARHGWAVFSDAWEVWDYGKSHGYGERGYTKIVAQVLSFLYKHTNSEIEWGVVSNTLPDSQAALVQDFLVAYQDVLMHLGGDNWAVFNGLYYVSDGEEKLGVSEVIDRAHAHGVALSILNVLLSEYYIPTMADHLADTQGIGRREATAKVREPFSSFLKFSATLHTGAHETSVLRMMTRRVFSSAKMNSVEAQGSLTVCNGTFFKDEDTIKFSPKRGIELARLRNSRCASVSWVHEADTTYTAADLRALWAGSDWERFLVDTIPSEEDALRLAMVVGDAVFGQQAAKFVTFLLGEKDSGKTVLIRALAATFGAYHSPIPMDIMIKSGTPDKFALEPLRGTRIGSASEGERGRALNTVMLKTISGRDEIKSRDLHKSYSTLRPEASIIFATNEVPQFPSGDLAFLDRLIWVKMALRAGVQKNAEIDNILRGCTTAILAWALWGSVASETRSRLEQLRNDGTAHESIEHTLENNLAMQLFMSCIADGHLNAVGTPDEWYDWRNAPGKGKNVSLRSFRGTKRSECIGGRSSRRLAEILESDGLLQPRTTTGSRMGITADELYKIILLQRRESVMASAPTAHGWENQLPNKKYFIDLLLMLGGGIMHGEGGERFPCIERGTGVPYAGSGSMIYHGHR